MSAEYMTGRNIRTIDADQHTSTHNVTGRQARLLDAPLW